MTISDITKHLESLFPLSSQASFDNCGLIVGNKGQNVTGAIICLDCTEEVVNEAIEKKVNLIIAHHPIVFNGLKKLNGKNYVERTVIKAIKNDIAIYAIHTNLDHSLKGVNAEIAQRLGINKPRILAPTENSLSKLAIYVPSINIQEVEDALFKAGAGNIGNYSKCSFVSNGRGSFQPMEGANPSDGEIGTRHYPEEQKLEVLVSNHKLPDVLKAMNEVHPYEVVAHDIHTIKNSDQSEGAGMIGKLDKPIEVSLFLEQIKKNFNCGIIRHTPILKEKIQTVAFCGGSGSFLLKDAIRQQADIFITGDFKYHEFFDAEDQLIIADIGHYESEQYTSNLLMRILSEKFTNFAVHLSRINTNPINYF